jgi:tetratricopeptide (TPR) repeat protein
MGRLPEAEQSYANAIKYMPDSWRADLMLGILYIASLDRPADAARHFRAAVDKVEAPGAQSFSSRPYLMLAGALYELGDDRGCREMLEKAARFPETRDEAISHLRGLNAESR